MLYKAIYENDNIEIFEADSNEIAIQCALAFGCEHGILFNVVVIDNDYNDIEIIF